MDFAVKSVVLFLLLVSEVFGRTIPLDDGSNNATEINNFIISKGGVSCQLEGVFHPLDSTFNVANDPCLVCKCDHNWTGSINNSSCFREECEDPQDAKLEDGCIPVYDEKKCCVIDFYCSDNVVPINEESTEIESNFTSEGSDEVVCPTPMCADSSCRIEVPPGWSCPTCICEEATKEQNELEPGNELSQEEPYGSQNSSEDSEMFLVPVSWSGVTKEGYVEEPDEEDEPNEEEYEEVEVEKPEIMKEGNEERELTETTLVDSSVNVIPGVDSKPNEPRRRKRHANSQTGPVIQQQQQQQGWTVFDEEDEGEREREDDSGEDFGEFKTFGVSEAPHSPSNEVSEEENAVDGPITSGCPTPTCEHSGCRIGVLPGHQCPTCICSERRQP